MHVYVTLSSSPAYPRPFPHEAPLFPFLICRLAASRRQMQLQPPSTTGLVLGFTDPGSATAVSSGAAGKRLLGQQLPLPRTDRLAPRNDFGSQRQRRRLSSSSSQQPLLPHLGFTPYLPPETLSSSNAASWEPPCVAAVPCDMKWVGAAIVDRLPTCRRFYVSNCSIP